LARSAGNPVTRAWKSGWFDSGVRTRSAALWRGVEAQHVVSTMRLADSLDEQRVLEELLETSKPPLPPEAAGRHYLVFTPFRYRSPVASRFRRATDPGIWYGAEELETACAEVAFWKWRFLTDSDALAGQALHTEHSFFQAKARGRCADLTTAPWKAAERSWRHRDDYSGCQDFAVEARERGTAWIRYASVRVAAGTGGAVLDVEALSHAEPLAQQTWACKTTRDGAYLQRAGEGRRYEFSAAQWQ
jgi:hypothetical protein